MLQYPVMWHLNLERLRALVPNGDLGRIAIETGTCRGNGTRKLAKNFSRVITIDVMKDLVEAARARLKAEGTDNVEFLCGNSAEILPDLLLRLPVNECLFFFLDAHWSGDRTVNWQGSTWKGYGLDTGHLGKSGELPKPEEQCPLAEELQIIVDNWPGPAVILVDDLDKLPENGQGIRDRGFWGEDWSHLSRKQLLSIVKLRFVNFKVLQNPDQLLIVLDANMPQQRNLPD